MASWKGAEMKGDLVKKDHHDHETVEVLYKHSSQYLTLSPK